MKITKEIAKEMIKTANKLLTEKALEAWPELGKKDLPTCFQEVEVNLKKEQAEASSILCALIIARDIYRDGYKDICLDWVLIPVYKSEEWGVIRLNWGLHLWSFQNQDTAILFLENFKEQLNIIKNLY